MSKRHRNKFERSPRDFYATPFKSALPLVAHLKAEGITHFAEPCCGAGDLIRHLESFGIKCARASDIALGEDAFQIAAFDVPVVTNPPFSIWRPMLDHFLKAAPSVWFLLMADAAHNKNFSQFEAQCSHIVSAGRACWFGGSGTENIAWYRFDAQHSGGPRFIGRMDVAA